LVVEALIPFSALLLPDEVVVVLVVLVVEVSLQVVLVVQATRHRPRLHRAIVVGLVATTVPFNPQSFLLARSIEMAAAAVVAVVLVALEGTARLVELVCRAEVVETAGLEKLLPSQVHPSLLLAVVAAEQAITELMAVVVMEAAPLKLLEPPILAVEAVRGHLAVLAVSSSGG